jgi:replicative DNA helicase
MPDIEIQDSDEAVSSSDIKFGKEEEKGIISLAFDQPDFFSAILPFLQIEFFDLPEARFVIGVIKIYFDKHGVIITRGICRDEAKKHLTVDDPFKEVLDLIDRELDPREAPIIIDNMTNWAKKRALGRVYSKESIEAYERGDTDVIEKIVEESQKVTNISTQCHFFFDEVQTLYVKENEEKFTTGFPILDMQINSGGPTRGELFCFMAPTGKGKSIALNNVGASNIKRKKNVLHVTLEMPWKQTAARYMACFTKIPLFERFNESKQPTITELLSGIRDTYNSELIIVEFPPDEISTDHVAAVIDNLRKIHGIKIDVVIIDYLELLLARHSHDNKEDYVRQKRVSTELSRLAKKENVVVYTAMQTNRSGNTQVAKGKEDTGSGVIGITHTSESYGKTMPMNYIVTLNQNEQEYKSGRLDKDNEKSPNINSTMRFHIVKNRNGPQFVTISIFVNYETMRMWDADLPTSTKPGDITNIEE